MTENSHGKVKSANGLECKIGSASCVLPVDGIGQIIESEVSPAPPFAKPWVAGLVLHAEHVWVMVRLTRDDMPMQEQLRPSRPNEGKLVLFKGEGDLRFGVQVDETAGLVEFERSGKEAPRLQGGCCPSRWLEQAQTKSGRDVIYVDTPRIENALRQLDLAEPVRQ